MIDTHEVKSLIVDIGFPVFVAIYFMFSFERTLRHLTKAIEALTQLTAAHIQLFHPPTPMLPYQKP